MTPVGPSRKPSLTQQNGLQIISSSLRLVGALTSGDVPNASEIADCMLVLNGMLDGWNAERTSVFQVAPITKDSLGNTLMLAGNKQTYTIGQETGDEDWYIARPPRIDRMSVLYSASQSTPVETPLDPLTDVEWQAVANKSTTSLIPEAYFDDLGYPNRTVYVWPVPTQANPVVLYAWTALTQFADAYTELSFPPGYYEAIRFNLAVRLAAEFPANLEKLQLVTKLAADAKTRIGSFNGPIKIATVDDALLGSRGRGNIYTGMPTRGSQN